jgi:hypothetical protein
MIYLILAMMRDQKGMKEAVGQRRLGWPLGRALIGSNVLIVGFGALGSELAVRLQPFGVTMTAVRRSGWQSPPTGAAAALHHRAHSDQLLSLLPAADVVVLTCTMVCVRPSRWCMYIRLPGSARVERNVCGAERKSRERRSRLPKRTKRFSLGPITTLQLLDTRSEILALPVPSTSYVVRREGMRVKLPQAVTVTYSRRQAWQKARRSCDLTVYGLLYGDAEP